MRTIRVFREHYEEIVAAIRGGGFGGAAMPSPGSPDMLADMKARIAAQDATIRELEHEIERLSVLPPERQPIREINRAPERIVETQALTREDRYEPAFPEFGDEEDAILEEDSP